MAAEAPLIMRLLAASVQASYKAGSIIRDILSKGELGIVEKGKNDLQTEADRSAQRCIMASLHQQFPKVALFGEEEQDPNDKVQKEWVETGKSADVLAKANLCPDNLKNVKDEEIVVWVDPLDGTSEYTEGLLDHVTVLIGIAVNGTATAGVIYQPYFNYQNPGAELGRAIWGVIGIGAFGYEPPTTFPEGHVVTTTRSHSNRTVVDAVDAVNPTEVLRVGGAGHKVLLLLEGHAHAYVFASPGCKKWDTCSPEAVLHAAGGKLTDIYGNTLPYHSNVQRRNTSGVLATLEADKLQWYIDTMPQHVRDALPFKP